MLNFGASKPRVKGGPGPWGPPGSAPAELVIRPVMHAGKTPLPEQNDIQV